VDVCVCKGCTQKKGGEGIIIGYRGASLLQVTSRRRRQAYKEDKHHPKKVGRESKKKSNLVARSAGISNNKQQNGERENKIQKRENP
jgi:hypothetical protein